MQVQIIINEFGEIFFFTFLKQLKMGSFGWVDATLTPRLRVGIIVRNISVAEEMKTEVN